MSISKTVADTIALNIIKFIVLDMELLSQFLTVTGLSLVSLRDNVQQPETLAAIVDFLLANEKALVRFCEDQSLSHEDIWRVRTQLPGSPAEDMC